MAITFSAMWTIPDRGAVAVFAATTIGTPVADGVCGVIQLSTSLIGKPQAMDWMYVMVNEPRALGAEICDGSTEVVHDGLNITFACVQSLGAVGHVGHDLQGVIRRRAGKRE